jgi:hypothetical protein
MSDWLERLSTLQVLLLTLAVLFGGSLVAALLGALLVRMGMRRPRVVQRASLLAERSLRLVRRPLTIVVLDEVSAVLRTGRYTQNIAAAIAENHDALSALVAEKVREDRHGRFVALLPGYEAVVTEVAETTLRVVVGMLQDPRMDELVNDLLRNNLEQIRVAVRERAHEDVAPPAPADPMPPGAATVG